MKITLDLDCKLFPGIFECGFILLGFLWVVFITIIKKKKKLLLCMATEPTETHSVTGH